MLKRIAFTFCLGFALLTIGCGKDEPATKNGATNGGTNGGIAKTGGGTTPKAKGWLDTAYIPDDAFAVVVLHPQRILDSELVKSAPLEEPLKEMQEKLGVDPKTIEQIVLSVVPVEPDPKASVKPNPDLPFEPDPGPPVSGGAVIRFSKPYDKDKIGGQAFSKDFREEKELNGKKYFESFVAAMYFIDDKTVLVFDPSAADKFLGKASTGKSPVLEALQKADGDQDIVVVIKPDAVKDQIPGEDDLPPDPDLQNAAKLAKHIETLTISGSLSPNLQLKFASTMDDAESAKKVQKMVQGYLAKGKALFVLGKDQIAAELPEDVANKAIDVIQKVLDSIQPTAKGTDFEVSVTAPKDLTELVAPLIAQAQEEAKKSALKSVSKNNLRQIGLAMHNYNEVHRNFPAAASVDADGKPLLSWRVHLLPFIDYADLYDQFKLDEPWDSENNKPLIEQMPEVFLKPGADNEGKTVYLVPVNEGAMFAGKEGPKGRDLTDGFSNTVMTIEVSEKAAVIWTKPDDLQFDPEKPFANLGDEFNILFADGYVDGFDQSLDPETLKAIITKAGGEPVELP